MHEANVIIDGLWKIRQQTSNCEVIIYKMEEPVIRIAEESMLSFEELRRLLIRSRSEVSDNE